MTTNLRPQLESRICRASDTQRAQSARHPAPSKKTPLVCTCSYAREPFVSHLRFPAPPLSPQPRINLGYTRTQQKWPRNVPSFHLPHLVASFGERWHNTASDFLTGYTNKTIHQRRSLGLEEAGIAVGKGEVGEGWADRGDEGEGGWEETWRNASIAYLYAR